MTQAVTTEPSASVKLCSQAGCKSPAEFSYMWPWGEPGLCCSAHRVHVQQRATQLERGQIHFVVLDPHKPNPLARDERTQLTARTITAEEDMRAAQKRASELLHQNAELAAEARRMKARNIELETQLRERTAERDTAMAERDTARADAGAAEQEVANLRAMLPRPE